MKLIYEGKDITRDVDIVQARHLDAAGGRRDCLDLVLEHADVWHGWKPERDDRIRMTMDGYDTGELYLSAVLPEEGRYRIVATGSPMTAKRKAWESFEQSTLSDIVSACAAQSRMGSTLYGVEGGFLYPYVLRENEECAKFLMRLLAREGATLKTYGGKYLAVGIEAAQALAPVATIRVSANQKGAVYIRRDDMRLSSLTAKTPYASATATDSAGGGEHEIRSNLPARDAATAGRWARGLLLMHNRQAEELTIESEFNPGFTALARIDVNGGTGADGEWMIDEVRHDFAGRKSRAVMRRVIRTIG